MSANVSSRVKKMAVLAMLCALAYVCVFVFRIKVSFLTFDAKDAIITLGALIYGPVSGLIVSLVVSFVEFFTISDTGVYGFLMNFLSSAAFSVTAGLIYKYRRKLSGALLGLGAAVCSMTVVMLLANLLITPYYMHCTVADVWALLPKLLLPFNLVKALLNAALTYILYRPVTLSLRKIGMLPKSAAPSQAKGLTVSLLLAAVAVIALAVVIYLVVLNGNFQSIFG